MRRVFFAALLAAVSVSNVVHGQTGLKIPLQITQIPGIASGWAGEGGSGCSSGVIVNTSVISRSNNYHAVILTFGSGTWSAAINYSDTACSGPWTSFGSTATITQASNPAIAFGNGNHSWVQIVVTGNAIVTYAGQNQLPLSTAVGSVSFPITIAQGGTNATTSALALANLLSGNAQGTYTNKVQMAGTNSGSSGAPICNDASGNTTTSGCSSVLPSGLQNQYLQILSNTGNLTTYAWAIKDRLVTTDFQNFAGSTAYQAPAENLSPSLRTVTLAPVPLGINGTDVGHRVSIFNTAGTFQETVLINGGSATSGSASGTVTFSAISGTYATGAYKIGTEAFGLPEAMQYACDNTTKGITIPASVYTAYGKIAVPCAGLSVRGGGGDETATWIDMVTGYTGRGIEAIVGSIDFGNLTVSYTTPGVSAEGIYVQDMGQGLLSNIFVLDAHNGITSWNTARVFYNENTLFTENNGYTFGSDPGSNTTPYVLGGVVAPGAAGNAIVLLPNLVGGIISNVGLSGGASGVAVVCSSGVVNEIAINGDIIDGYSTVGIDLSVTGSCSSARWQILGNKLAGAAGDALGIRVSSPAAPGIAGLAILGNLIGTSAAGATPVILAGVQGALVQGNFIYLGGAGGGNGVSLVSVANSNIDIKDNNIGADQNWSSTPAATNAVALDAHAHAAINISGNTLLGSGAALSNSSTTANGVQWRNNKGIDDVIGTAASAGTLAFPVNPNVTLSGSTPTTAVSGLFTGRSGTVMATDGPLYFVSGATVGNTVSLPQNVPVPYYFDGTKIWLSPPLSAIVSTAAAANSTSSVGSTALLTAPTPGLYRVSWALNTGSVSGGTGTALVTIGWTDAVGAKTSAGAALTLAAAANQSGSVVVNVASGNITYATTYAAGSGGNYNLKITAELVK